MILCTRPQGTVWLRSPLRIRRPSSSARTELVATATITPTSRASTASRVSRWDTVNSSRISAGRANHHTAVSDAQRQR